MQEDILDDENTPPLRRSIFRYSMIEITIALSNLIILSYALLNQDYNSFPTLSFKALILLMTLSTCYLIYRWSYFVTRKNIAERRKAFSKFSHNTVALGLGTGVFWGFVGLSFTMSIVMIRTWEINQIIVPSLILSLGIIQSMYAGIAMSKYKQFKKELLMP